MITHTVFFKLKHAAGSSEERDFLSTAQLLAKIPGVKNFKTLREVSPKNEFTFGFSMEFDSQETYDAYSSHPEHDEFVQQRWIPEVVSFQEIDFVNYH